MGVQVILKVYAEEIDYRVEPLLATALTRPKYLASNVLVALGGTLVGMVLAGTALGIVASAKDDSVSTTNVIWQSIAAVPAVWVLIGIAIAAVGAAPTKRLIAWLGVVATFGLTILGPTFKLPDWALDISPLRHVPNVTGTSPDWGGLAWLCVIATAITVVGFLGYRRRDII
jgi:polyether ionophore transport system permease protein